MVRLIAVTSGLPKLDGRWQPRMVPDGSGGPVKPAVERATRYDEARTGRVHALGRFFRQVRRGKFVYVIGPSGCGKSTLLWSMATVAPATAP
jgi:NitT/TauT family transport system ATP-binding protein